MKISRGSVICVLITLAVCTGLLTLAGILLLPAQISSPELSVHENVSGVGYADHPQNRGLFFTDSKGRGAFIYLNFSEIVTQVYFFEENANEEAQKLPYLKDYTFTIDDRFLPSLCDRLGGIEMTDEYGEKSLYFSASMAQFLEKSLNEEKIQKISLSFFEKIAKTGLSSEDFMFIIESAQTDLSYSVCYDWIPHIKEMFSNCIIN